MMGGDQQEKLVAIQFLADRMFNRIEFVAKQSSGTAALDKRENLRSRFAVFPQRVGEGTELSVAAGQNVPALLGRLTVTAATSRAMRTPIGILKNCAPRFGGFGPFVFGTGSSSIALPHGALRSESVMCSTTSSTDQSIPAGKAITASAH